MVQLQTINYLLDSKNTVLLKELKESYFNEYVNEFNFIKNHFDKYGTIPDKSTFLDTFDEFDIITVSESPTYLLKELKEDRKKRYIIDVYNNIGKCIVDGKIDDAFNVANSAGSSDLDEESEKYIDLLNPTDRFNKYLDKCENIGAYYITTGFKELDNIIGGWDAEEELGVIVARPNVGKSMIAIKCATTAAMEGYTVGFYSGEMSANKVGYRIDTFVEHLPNFNLTHGDRSSEIQYRKYIENLPGKFKGKLIALTADNLHRPATVQDLKNFIIDCNLDILFVDQYSLLEDTHHGKTDVERFSNLSKDLKNLQVQLRKPIISVSQQNRTTTEGEDVIDLSHIAQADRIAQDATTVLFLTYKDGILSMHLSKARDSEKDKKINYIVDWNIGEFNYEPEPDRESIDDDGANDSTNEGTYF